MKKFAKVNIISLVYAFLLFLVIELTINVYRISRITGLNINSAVVIIILINLIITILLTVAVILILKRSLLKKTTSYWSALIWFPYFVLFSYMFTTMFPLQSYETLNPIIGIFIYGIIICYPFYILMISRYS